MNILSISTIDRSGGAEKVAYDLFKKYRLLGHQSILSVGKRTIFDNDIVEIHNNTYRNSWTRLWREKQEYLSNEHSQIQSRLVGWFANLGEVNRWIQWQRGIEDFNYPGTHQIINHLSIKPDIIHLHNLHGGYFDLNALSCMSQKNPCVITLHDEWTYTGHCAYTLGCERWETGCGKCPHLDTYPALKRDGTSYNWRRKQSIYAHSKLYVAAPSRWLLDRAARSVLKEATIETRIIPNGIDLSIFNPGNKSSARKQLNLPLNANIALFVANKITTNPFKDFSTIESAIKKIAAAYKGKKLIFICLGEDLPERQISNAIIRFIPYKANPPDIALIYQSSDVYLHAARIDNYPLAIIEALSCGVPVIATAVGGIPEMLQEGQDGFLVPAGNSEMMAERAQQIFNDNNMANQMSSYAATTAKIKYDLQRQAQEYLMWFETIIKNHVSI